MKVPLENIINDLNDRLANVEVAVLESRRAMTMVLKKVDFLLHELNSGMEEFEEELGLSKQMKTSPFSLHIEECFNQLLEMDSGLESLKELEKELEKYSDEITGMGES